MKRDTYITDFSDRLNRALDDFGMPGKGHGRQVKAAKLFGLTQKAVRAWLEGEGLPDTKKIPEIAKTLGVSAEWLLTGEGANKASGKQEDSVFMLALKFFAEFEGLTKDRFFFVRRWINTNYPQIESSLEIEEYYRIVWCLVKEYAESGEFNEKSAGRYVYTILSIHAARTGQAAKVSQATP